MWPTVVQTFWITLFGNCSGVLFKNFYILCATGFFSFPIFLNLHVEKQDPTLLLQQNDLNSSSCISNYTRVLSVSQLEIVFKVLAVYSTDCKCQWLFELWVYLKLRGKSLEMFGTLTYLPSENLAYIFNKLSVTLNSPCQSFKSTFC